MRKIIYIAGPISRGDLCHNINQGTAAFVALAKAGFAPICPMWSVYAKPATYSRYGFPRPLVWCEATAMGNDGMTHEDWMGIDLPFVSASAAVLRLPGESRGADMETAHAEANGIPVFTSVDGLLEHFSKVSL